MTSKILRADGVTELASIQTVTYHESVNADIDLRPGCVASNYIEVTCFGAQSDAPDVGEALTYYQVVGGTETLIGTFYAEPSIPTKNSYSFIAYDAVHKLDADFSAWLSAHQDDFPYTVKQLVEQACTISGVMLGTSAWDHSTMEVNAWYADGLTCRNILQYAAEIACKFVRCNTDGEIVFDWYKGAASGDTKTASGTIATFDDGADRVPLKSLTAQITPAQDLHGYSNPWPAGGGKNKLPIPTSAVTDHGITATPNADGTITLTGTATGTQAYIDLDTNFNSSLYAGYILTGLPSSESWNQASVCIRISNQDSRASIQDITRVNGTYISNVITDNGDNLRISIRINAGYACPSEGVKLDLMLRAPTESSTFAPYSNICPISGWTGMNAWRTDVNVWDEEWESGYIDSADGVPKPSSTHIRTKNFIPVKETSYYNKGYTLAILGYDYEKNYVGFLGNKQQGVFTIPSGVSYIKFYRTATTYNHDISINYPSIDAEYHAYTGETLSVSWQDTAGTVYGGSMTVNEDGSGVLTVTYAELDLGTLLWVKDVVLTRFYSELPSSVLAPETNEIVLNAISSMFKPSSASYLFIHQTVDGIMAMSTSKNLSVRSIQMMDKTSTEFKAAMSGVQLLYKLATPLTYHFYNLEQLTTLIGTNNIWATTGDVEVEYYPTLGRIYPSSGTDDSGDRFAYKQDGLTYDNYDTSAVARVAVHPVGEDEVAYYYPTNVTSGKTLNITNNALLYGASAENMTAIAQSIYTTMTAFGTYRPMSVEMFPNECPFRCGDIVPVTDAQGVSFTTAIMEKTVTDSAVTFTSTGREVYGDYALDTAKRLVQLASDIVRINKLKVGWAEIDEAVVGVLTSIGMNPDEVVVSANTVTEYYLSTSSSSATGGSWGTSIPTWSSGKYVWTRDKTTNEYADGTSSTSYSPAQNGVYDANLTTALSTAASASSAASTAQSTANGANAREQTIYISKASGTSSVPGETTWVTYAADSQNRWTTKRPVYNSSYPVLFIAQQRQTVTQYNGGSGTACSCTTPVKDDTTTVIDGGHITTGTIDASRVNVTNINASNITTGALTVKDASNNIIFQADATNKTARIGDWVASASELQSTDTSSTVLHLGQGELYFDSSQSYVNDKIGIYTNPYEQAGTHYKGLYMYMLLNGKGKANYISGFSINYLDTNSQMQPLLNITASTGEVGITSYAKVRLTSDLDVNGAFKHTGATVSITDASAWRTALGLDIIPFKISTTVLSGSYIRYPVGSATDDRITANHIAIINPYYSTGFMNNYFFTGQCANGYANIYVRTSTGEQVAAGTTMNLAGIFVKT